MGSRREHKNQSTQYITSQDICIGPEKVFGKTLDLTVREKQELRGLNVSQRNVGVGWGGVKPRARSMRVQVKSGAKKYSSWLTKGRCEDRAVLKMRKS